MIDVLKDLGLAFLLGEVLLEGEKILIKNGAEVDVGQIFGQPEGILKFLERKLRALGVEDCAEKAKADAGMSFLAPSPSVSLDGFFDLEPILEKKSLLFRRKSQ